MSQRKTVTCPNPDVLAQAVAVRVLTTIRNLLAEPGRSRVDIALTGGTDGDRVLRAIGTDGMTDYIGLLQVRAPASVQFKLTATRGGSRADIATSAELYPR